MTLNKLVDSFLDEIQKVRRYSPQTLRAYRNDLYQFLSYCRGFNIETIDSIKEKIIRKYIMSLNEERLSTTSIARKLSSLRSFFDYSIKNDFIIFNPITKIIGPKIKRNLPEIISYEEFLRIPQEIENTKKISDKVNHRGTSSSNSRLFSAIIELLYSCALRVSELCNLNFGDVDLTNNSIRVLGKGSKTRIVPIGNESIKVLKEYLETRKLMNSRSPLFTASSGIRLYPRLVHKIVSNYLSKVSDIKRRSPHILRHSAATHMLDRGADLLAVKEILGHENLSTTQIYTHVSIERLKKVHKQAHPKS